MNLPRKIKVGNIAYKVRTKKLKNTFGTHCPVKQELIIDRNLPKDMERNTFFHELTHAIFFQVGAFDEQKNEILVQSVANELDKLFELKPIKK